MWGKSVWGSRDRTFLCLLFELLKCGAVQLRMDFKPFQVRLLLHSGYQAQSLTSTVHIHCIYSFSPEHLEGNLMYNACISCCTPKIEYLHHVCAWMCAKFSLSWSQDVTDVTFKRKRLLTINNEAGLEVTVDFGKLMTNCQIKHAWARTIHTFQVREDVYKVIWIPACIRKSCHPYDKMPGKRGFRKSVWAHSPRVWALMAGKA